jgi:hypothetical protein
MPSTFAEVMELGEKVAAETIGILNDARKAREEALRLDTIIGQDRPEGAPANVTMLHGQGAAIAEVLEGAIGDLAEAAEDATFLLRSLEAAQAAAEAVGVKGGDS